MNRYMWLEGINETFLIGEFVFGSSRGAGVFGQSYGLCSFNGRCIGDIDVKKQSDWISGKLLSAAATGKTFPTGKISVVYLDEYERKSATMGIYLLNATIVSFVTTEKGDETISFGCSDISIQYG